MDTIEELNGIYFYRGLNNITAMELLFWILIEETEKQLGIQDIAGVAALLMEHNGIDVPVKPGSATPGTSYASVYSRKYLSYRFQNRVLPTLTKKSISLNGLKVFLINNMGAFVGRAVPVLGWVILANDVSQISFRTASKYNVLVRNEDKIW